MAATVKVDGTFSFYGGMDLSRVSYEVGERQFVKGINVSITTVGDNVQPRPGWHWQTIKWNSPLEQQRFEEGHVQGGGWYFDGAGDRLVVSVSGLIFFFAQLTQGTWSGRALNLGNPNNSTRTKVWCCRIPGNRLILSDGQALPYVMGLDGSFVRTDPSQGQMGVCRMMTYVQNRLWWVNETGNLIYGSDIQDPLSIQEAIDTNIFGFVPPDDRETITAIGTQRYVNFDQNGGELVFSTDQNVYAVNVQANVPRANTIIGNTVIPGWGYQSNVGTVRLVIPKAGATSAYSFENYNTNLFYRAQGLGVVNYKQMQAQWQNNDELISNSIEVDYWYKKDTPWMLDQCWTVNYRGRLLSTVSPTLVNGYVYWRGLISMNPAPYYGALQRLPRRFEGLWTGVQPWCLLHQLGPIEKLFTVSYDGDGKNRIYQLADNDRYDIGPGDKRKPIECIIETRSFTFDTMYSLKTMVSRFYTLDQINSDVFVKAYSRSTLQGMWFPFFDVTHRIGQCCAQPTEESCLFYNPVPPESRNEFYMPGEVERCGDDQQKRFNYRQYRLEFTGEFELSGLGFTANIEPDKSSVLCGEPPQRFVTEPICPLKDFGYQIVPVVDLTQSPNGVTPKLKSTSSSCGCN